MIIPICAVVIRVLWLLLEFPFVRRHRITPAKNWDRRSAMFWDAANLLEPLGLLLGFIGIGRIEAVNSLIQMVGLTMLVVGIAVRWTAIRTLGKYFTSTVVI